ncbi:MFS transporter [Tropicimonas sp. TH_r6]|uniref:MFS transporter n=1 Tax=Tropicimonas sp. TH_r6 TaxID=3082085 RepID=UPI002953DE8B|nr:MFS transporter [Tropicimonas sp. TH_r6]MDV7142596.1 MFS transporter [Tropicimonas sp. TH_r6]
MASGTFAPFTFRTYRLLWFAALASNLGGLIQNVGAGWLMTSLSDAPVMVALVQGSVTLPLAVLSLLGGVFADNYERRNVMIAAQGFMLVASALLAALAWIGGLGPWGLLAFTFAIGCGQAIHLPSWQASVGDLVPREHLPQAVMLNGMGFNLMRSAGPALGGVIVAVFGAAAAFVVNTITYVPVLLVLAGWKPERAPDPLPREPIGAALRAGMRYAALSADHLRIMFRGAIFGLSAVAVLAIMPLVARQLLDGTAVTFGTLLASFGMGAVTSALSMRHVRAHLANEKIVRGSFTLMATGLVVIGMSGSVWLTGAAAFLCGSAWQSAMSLFNVAAQLSTPRWVLGRIMSLLQVFTFSGMTLGSYVWGRLASETDIPTALTAAALLCLLGTLVGFVMPLPNEDGRNLDPFEGFTPPEPALDITMQSGPIKVSVEFRIPSENTDAFLKVMAARRVIRLRDGANGWSLYRDLNDPGLWHESYRVSTWAEYHRHMARRTTADAENYRELEALHAGDTAPRARRWIERPAEVRQQVFE